MLWEFSSPLSLNRAGDRLRWNYKQTTIGDFEILRRGLGKKQAQTLSSNRTKHNKLLNDYKKTIK